MRLSVAYILLFACQIARASILIDDFSADHPLTCSGSPVSCPPGHESTTAPAPGTFSGHRTVSVTRSSGPLGLYSLVDDVLYFSSDPGTSGSLTVVWDRNVQVMPNVNLLPVFHSIEIGYATTDSAGGVGEFVIEGGTGAVSATFTVVGSSSGRLSLPLGLFLGDVSALESVSRITFRFNGSAGADVEFDDIRVITVGADNIATPEIPSAGMVAPVAILLYHLRRRISPAVI